MNDLSGYELYLTINQNLKLDTSWAGNVSTNVVHSEDQCD